MVDDAGCMVPFLDMLVCRYDIGPSVLQPSMLNSTENKIRPALNGKMSITVGILHL